MSSKFNRTGRLTAILFCACCLFWGCKNLTTNSLARHENVDEKPLYNPLIPQPSEQELSRQLSPLGDPLKPEEIVRPKADEMFDQSGTIIKAQNRMPKGPISFYDYLNVMWRKFGCSFTIEFLRKEGEFPAPLEFGSVINNDREIESIDGLISKLQQEFPHCQIVQDAKNPKVLHLMDDRLKSLKSYALDQKTTLTFKGKLGDLPVALGKKIEGVGLFAPPKGMSPLPSNETPVSIKEKNYEIRQLLTDHIPQAGRHILWVGETTIEGGMAKTGLLLFEKIAAK